MKKIKIKNQEEVELTDKEQKIYEKGVEIGSRDAGVFIIGFIIVIAVLMEIFN